jgi:hypothetical protein
MGNAEGPKTAGLINHVAPVTHIYHSPFWMSAGLIPYYSLGLNYNNLINPYLTMPRTPD